jgi:hypothetical protein
MFRNHVIEQISVVPWNATLGDIRVDAFRVGKPSLSRSVTTIANSGTETLEFASGLRRY